MKKYNVNIGLDADEVYNAYASLQEKDRNSINDSIEKIAEHVHILRIGPDRINFSKRDGLELLSKIGILMAYKKIEDSP